MQSPVADMLGRGCNRDYFRVRSWVVELMPLIAAFGDDLILMNYDCSDRHIVVFQGDIRLVDCRLHKLLVLFFIHFV
jgi:hypothetical protein